MAEEYIQFIYNTTLPVSLPVKTLLTTQDNDEVLKSLKHNIASGIFPKSELTKDYYPLCAELSIVNNMLLYKNKTVIPSSLQLKTIELAHEGH